jgi:glycosyltransferase involved in cell wall biosynthesis
MRENLKTEQEIMKNWKGDIEKPLVCISCKTYNHELYIEDAIKGFLMQETNFPFIVLIHDDFSTDKTAEIVRKYESKYPNIIRAYYQKKNTYTLSPSERTRLRKPFGEMRKGEYFAFCEGDDYWTNPLKLQKQIDLLESDKDINFSFHNSKRICYESGDEQIVGKYAEKTMKLPFEDILLRPWGMIPTASCIITKEAASRVRKFGLENTYLTQGDIYLQYISAYEKGAFYINETMSVYRFKTEGSWTKRNSVNPTFQTTVLLNKLKSFLALKSFLNPKDPSAFSQLFIHYFFMLNTCLLENDSKNAQIIDSICENLVLKTIKNNNLFDKSVILYGASSTTKWVINKFKNIFKIKYILDSDPSKHDSYFEGYQIKFFNKAKIEYPVLFTLFGREHFLAQISDFNKHDIIVVKEEQIELLYEQAQDAFPELL